MVIWVIFTLLLLLKKLWHSKNDGDMPEGLKESQLEEAPFGQIMGTLVIKINNDSNRLKPI